MYKRQMWILLLITCYSCDLKDECYTDSARYMSDVPKYYVNERYPVTHISPVNEPQYNWDSGQEGSGLTNDEVARLIRDVYKRQI